MPARGAGATGAGGGSSCKLQSAPCKPDHNTGCINNHCSQQFGNCINDAACGAAAESFGNCYCTAQSHNDMAAEATCLNTLDASGPKAQAAILCAEQNCQNECGLPPPPA